MTPRRGAFEALARALSLARRIPAGVFVLFVVEDSHRERSEIPPMDATEDRRRVRLMLERARANGVAVDSFVAEGAFEDEVIRFAKENRITLLVAENVGAEQRATDRENQSLREIRHRISCRVEVVTPRPDET
jgi:nucleotide-binding universal stress UspA family protein